LSVSAATASPRWSGGGPIPAAPPAVGFSPDHDGLGHDVGARPIRAFTHHAPADIEARFALEEARSRGPLDAVARGTLALCVFSGAIVFVEPSPYEYAFLLSLIVWLAHGIRFHRALIAFLLFLLPYNIGGIVSLIPWAGETVSLMFVLQSCYLMTTGVFFAMVFSHDTVSRLDTALKAFTLSCLVAALAGFLGYSDDPTFQELFRPFDRAAGTFKDPNVFGSYCILGFLFLFQKLTFGTAKRPLLATVVLLTIFAGIFLSFSRGSWVALALATALTIGFAFFTSHSHRIRARIVTMGAAGLAVAVLVAVAVVAIGDFDELFEKRLAVTQDYDEGPTGRFGNQVRSIPMLLDRVNGFGPLRFRTFFGLEPHNSYIGGFAAYGWLGGIAYLGLVATTSVLVLRLMIQPSPMRRQAQVISPALLMFFVQAVQIDIDHWRHVYLMMGMVWGMEVARQRWLAFAAKAAQAPA